MHSTPETFLEAPARKRTAVSQVLRALHLDLETEVPCWMPAPAPGASPGRVLVARDPRTRRRAWNLAYRVYAGCGYVEPHPDEVITSAYDLDPATFTLLVEDEQRSPMATVTLVFDSVRRLPCDEIFGAEVDALRNEGRKVAEVTRLAIDDRHTGSKSLLVTLFNGLFLLAWRLRGFDDFVIEVNPRHVNYYRRLLKFSVAGPERPCPRVNGAPAVLLRMDLWKGEKEIRRLGGVGPASTERTVYPYFLPLNDECAMLSFLRTQESATA